MIFFKNIYERLFNSGHARSNRAKKNVAVAFVCKGGSIGVSLLMVPMTLSYLTKTEYGIWLTMSTIISWFTFFDIGLANGLRNRLGEAMARNDTVLARTYVSTAFGMLGLVTLIIGVCLFISNGFINWSSVFNTNPEMSRELGIIMLFLGVFFCINFILQIANIVLATMQRTAINDIVALVGSVLSLGGMWVLIQSTSSSLKNAIFVFSGIPVIVSALLFPYVFGVKYKFLMPSIKFFKKKRMHDVLGVGFQFFIIQLSVLVMFSTTNVIITQLFSPEDVVPYNISFKYFSVITMLFNLAMAPLWSAYTEAFVRGDFGWIKHSLKKGMILWGGAVLMVVIMVCVAGVVYKVWTKGIVDVPFAITLSVAFYTVVATWSNIFAIMRNGVGKIRLSLYNCMVTMVVFIPLAVFLGKQLGVFGVPLAMCIISLPGAIMNPIQCWKLANQTATGIWNK